MALFTRYRITYVSDSLFMSVWGCVYTALRETDTLYSNNLVQLCSASAGGTKMDPVQSVPFSVTSEHRNLIRNNPKPRFDNGMASMQIRLLDCLANRQRKTNMVHVINYFDTK